MTRLGAAKVDRARNLAQSVRSIFLYGSTTMISYTIARRVCLGVLLAFLVLANFDGVAFDVSGSALRVAGGFAFLAFVAITWIERKQGLTED